MACGCIKKVNEQLAKQNGQLSIGLGIDSSNKFIARLLVGTEKKDIGGRKKPPIVSATFCPFCGTKFDGCAMGEPQAEVQEGGAA